MIRILLCTLAAIVSAPMPAALCQVFQNLDFESGSTAQDTLEGTFPGWNFTPEQGTYLGHHLSEGPRRTLHYTDMTWPPVLPFAGNFSLFLQAGMDSTAPNSFIDIAITQTAIVPASAKSIRLLALSQDPFLIHAPSSPDNPPAWRLLLNGEEVNMVSLGSEGNALKWGGNISAHSGQLRTLSIVAESDYRSYSPFLIFPFPPLLFDNIEFSSNPVPEPASGWLAAIGLSFAFLRVKRSVTSSKAS